MIKTFSKLEPGDKLYKIFPNGKLEIKTVLSILPSEFIIQIKLDDLTFLEYPHNFIFVTPEYSIFIHKEDAIMKLSQILAESDDIVYNSINSLQTLQWKHF